MCTHDVVRQAFLLPAIASPNLQGAHQVGVLKGTNLFEICVDHHVEGIKAESEDQRFRFEMRRWFYIKLSN